MTAFFWAVFVVYLSFIIGDILIAITLLEAYFMVAFHVIGRRRIAQWIVFSIPLLVGIIVGHRFFIYMRNLWFGTILLTVNFMVPIISASHFLAKYRYLYLKTIPQKLLVIRDVLMWQLFALTSMFMVTPISWEDVGPNTWIGVGVFILMEACMLWRLEKESYAQAIYPLGLLFMLPDIYRLSTGILSEYSFPIGPFLFTIREYAVLLHILGLLTSWNHIRRKLIRAETKILEISSRYLGISIMSIAIAHVTFLIYRNPFIVIELATLHFIIYDSHKRSYLGWLRSVLIFLISVTSLYYLLLDTANLKWIIMAFLNILFVLCMLKKYGHKYWIRFLIPFTTIAFLIGLTPMVHYLGFAENLELGIIFFIVSAIIETPVISENRIIGRTYFLPFFIGLLVTSIGIEIILNLFLHYVALELIIGIILIFALKAGRTLDYYSGFSSLFLTRLIISCLVFTELGENTPFIEFHVINGISAIILSIYGRKHHKLLEGATTVASTGLFTYILSFLLTVPQYSFPLSILAVVLSYQLVLNEKENGALMLCLLFSLLVAYIVNDIFHDLRLTLLAVSSLSIIFPSSHYYKRKVLEKKVLWKIFILPLNYPLFILLKYVFAPLNIFSSTMLLTSILMVFNTVVFFPKRKELYAVCALIFSIGVILLFFM